MVRIVEFWAKGFRSLRDVHIRTDRPFNVFYGPNGAGKSNILAGMETLLDMTIKLGTERASQNQAFGHELLPGDRCVIGGDTPTTTLGLTVASRKPFFATTAHVVRWVSYELTQSWQERCFRCTRLEVASREDGEDARTPEVFNEEYHPTSTGTFISVIYSLLGEGLARNGYTLVDADRIPRSERDTARVHTNSVEDFLRSGELVKALYYAASDPDRSVRKRLESLRALLEGEPLNRPRFDIVRAPETGDLDLREPFDGPRGALDGEADISWQYAGLGIAQIYSILAQLLLSGTRTAGIEEPEAHLHAPTSGRQLRTLFERMVGEGHLDQLFIATHSSLFDLDIEGYHDVSYDRREGTRVEWKPLAHLDRDHLFETGPARHALMDFLRSMGEEDVGLRTADGEMITTSEMIEHLHRDDDLAETFLREMHSSAARLAQLKLRKRDAEAEAGE